jgi:hypothetical protein
MSSSPIFGNSPAHVENVAPLLVANSISIGMRSRAHNANTPGSRHKTKHGKLNSYRSSRIYKGFISSADLT